MLCYFYRCSVIHHRPFLLCFYVSLPLSYRMTVFNIHDWMIVRCTYTNGISSYIISSIRFGSHAPLVFLFPWSQRLTLFGFQIFWPSTFLMNVIPEMRRAHWIWYFRFYHNAIMPLSLSDRFPPIPKCTCYKRDVLLVSDDGYSLVVWITIKIC